MDSNQVSVREKAMIFAIDYHSRIYGPVNLQEIPDAQKVGRPSVDEIITTAEKFAEFLGRA